uniref:Uncharacterized protein n=1 Tax=Dipterosiphonia australica TaxID=2007208 RepID=A0A1Z1MLG1_9FLOR|nr:hypothetical protein [Dipterosiphonia australica]ARW66927.1 hypothetical protein [Dipterosiphonia australica]
MTDKKKIFLKKVDLLIISLEILNKYFNKNQNNIEFQKIRDDLQNYKSYSICSFIKIIQYIYSIQLLIKRYLIHEISNEILKNYTNYGQCNIVNKYHKKFYSISTNKKEYYKNYKIMHDSFKNDINIKYISIINLYIISKLVTRKGIYNLIIYLFN